MVLSVHVSSLAFNREVHKVQKVRISLLKTFFELDYLGKSFPPHAHFKNATISIFTFKLAFVKSANMLR